MIEFHVRRLPSVAKVVTESESRGWMDPKTTSVSEVTTMVYNMTGTIRVASIINLGCCPHCAGLSWSRWAP